jgi:hypothetical protein
MLSLKPPHLCATAHRMRYRVHVTGPIRPLTCLVQQPHRVPSTEGANVSQCRSVVAADMQGHQTSETQMPGKHREALAGQD